MSGFSAYLGKITRKRFGFTAGPTSSFPPPPPYLVASNGTILISTITGLGFTEGDTPPESALFGIFADGLLPATGNITITSSSSSLQFWNGVSFQSTPLTFPYTGGAVNMGLTGTVRLNPVCIPNTYNETLTISTDAVNVSSWVINCSGVVAPADYIQFTTDATVTVVGDFYILRGTTSGYLNISALSTITSRNDYDMEMGAGGGGGSSRGAGGAGGIKKATITATVGNFPFIVGSGGVGGVGYSVTGTVGGNSTFNGLTAYGGGQGGAAAVNFGEAYPGGSGGGGSTNLAGTIAGNGGLAVSGQGNIGGNGSLGGVFKGGGGGGAGAAGTSGALGGNGGVGLLSAIDGNWYGGGGGGGSNGGVVSTGGTGGGGNGSINATAASNGTANTSGGGGAGGTGNSGNGGSGYWLAKIRKSG